MVDYYGRRDKNNGQLVNLSDGGGTKRNYKHTDDFKIKMKVICSENHRDKKIYSFVNCITEEEFTGTRQDFRNRYDIEPNSLFRKGNFKVVKNWKLKDSIVTDSMSLSNTIVRTRIYKFIHRSGEQFIGTRLEFSNKFKLNMNRLFMKNSRKSLYGWKVEEA